MRAAADVESRHLQSINEIQRCMELLAGSQRAHALAVSKVDEAHRTLELLQHLEESAALPSHCGPPPGGRILALSAPNDADRARSILAAAVQDSRGCPSFAELHAMTIAVERARSRAAAANEELEAIERELTRLAIAGRAAERKYWLHVANHDEWAVSLAEDEFRRVDAEAVLAMEAANTAFAEVQETLAFFEQLCAEHSEEAVRAVGSADAICEVRKYQSVYLLNEGFHNAYVLGNGGHVRVQLGLF